MIQFLQQGLLTDLSIVILVGVADGIYRITGGGQTAEEARRDDLIRRGYIL